MNMIANVNALRIRSRIVEIVGPAGAGKTTLVKILSQRIRDIEIGVNPIKLVYIPFFLQNTLAFLPTFTRCFRQTRWFTWDESRSMVYLNAWHYLLSQRKPYGSKTILLDQGPIYRLTLLREFGPEITNNLVYQRWWNNTLNQWMAILDLIIWLDAPDTILMERIQTRSRQHRVQQKPEQAVFQFLERYRGSYEDIINRIAANGNLQVLRFDTNQESSEQVVDKVLGVLN